MDGNKKATIPDSSTAA